MSEQRQASGQVPAWTLGWRLRRALAFAGIESEAMADDLGVARSTVSRWMNDHGERPPRKAFLMQWAMRCGVSYEWLRSGQASPDDGGPITAEAEFAWTSRPLRLVA